MLLLHRVLILFITLSSVLVLYLYTYPAFHACRFPSPADASPSIWSLLRYKATSNTAPPQSQAPFRLLALGDPQLEGDTSIPKDVASLESLWSDFRSVQSLQQRADVVRRGIKDVLRHKLPAKLQGWRKQLDLVGNDYYLAHIYRSLHHYTKPTHVTVLGDLLGSQWIDDEEFERRGWRFWKRVFQHGQRVEDAITDEPSWEFLEEETPWTRRIMNIAGNHDVGYAGDMTVERVERFERVFGKANWEIRFRLPFMIENTTTGDNGSDGQPELRIVILNSLNMDTPAMSEELQSKTYDFINQVITRSRPVEDRTTGTIVLTHIPLHKAAGVCVDAPFFDFHDSNKGGGVKEQYHLSYEAGRSILEGIFGMSPNPDVPARGLGRNGIILTGHDHEGCDVYHHVPADEDVSARKWNATRWHHAGHLIHEPIPGIREVTVRSMMGDFGGNAGLLSAWFDQDLGEWQFAYSSCSVGVQHIWWAVHILVLVTIGLSSYVCVTGAFGSHTVRSLRKGASDLGKNAGQENGVLVSRTEVKDFGKGYAKRRR